MDEPNPTTRRPHLLAVVVLSAVVGGLAGGGVTAVVMGSGAASDRQPPPAVIEVLPAAAEGDVDGVASVAEVVLPAVVRVDVRGLDAGATGNASGVVIRTDGHLVTNHHVVAGATAITVTFADGESVPATLIGSDPRTDLAVLQVDVDGLPALSLTEIASPRVGQQAIALGSPYGLSGSVTVGVVSAVDRDVDLRGGPGGGLTRLPGVVQTDAGISPGNSGGPLVDSRGRLIGINSAVLSEDVGAGVGFAIPAGTVAEVVEQLITEGRVPRALLGLAGRSITADTPDGVTGALVDRVAPDGPAAGAGVVPGDVVVAVDGRPVRGMDDLVQAVGDAAPGATIMVDIVREDEHRTVAVTLADAQEQ